MVEESFDVKKRLMRLVERYPGLHLGELAREADVSKALAGYHLDALEEEGHLESRTEEGYRRFYPLEAPGPDDEERELLTVLRRPIPLEVTVYLIEEGPASHSEITDQVDLAKSTVTYHLGNMQDAGVVKRRDDDRFELTDRRRIERLLIRWEPPTGLVDRFADLWRRFYYQDE